MRPRTLRGLGLAFLLLFTASATIVGIGVYAATHDALDREVDRRLAATATDVLSGSGTPGLAGVVRRIDVLERRRESRDLGFMLVDGAGRRVAGTLRIAMPVRGYSSVDRRDAIPGLVRGRALVVPVGRDHLLALVAESEPIDGFDSSFVRVLLAGLGALVAIVAIGVTALTATIRRRIADLRRAAGAIIDGDMDRRVRVDRSGSEFDQQAQMLNRMLDRIQHLMAGIRHVAHDAAHELRTPLARLRLSIAALARSADSVAVREGAEDALAQADDLLGVFAAILRIADVEGGDRRAHFAPVDLSRMVDDVASAYRPAVEEADKSLRVASRPGVSIHGDRRLLEQMLANLIENAVHHTPPRTAISVRLTADGGRVTIVVADDGPGIPAEDRALAMKRFGRLRVGDRHNGHGLGLPLVIAIARLHHGDATLHDAAPGVEVRVTIATRVPDGGG